MIKIGIIARKIKSEKKITYFGIKEPNLRNQIIKNGGVPVLLIPEQILDYSKEERKPNEEETERSLALIKECDGIILPGGETWTYLDELALDYALQKKVPILGICLGMQIMGSNHQIKRVHRLNTENHQSLKEYVHEVTIDKDSKLFKIIKEQQLKVNSRHQYTIEEPKDWDIVARSSDGVIEAIEKKEHPFCVGIQWHPEDLLQDKSSDELFQAFIETCKKEKNKYNK